MKTMLSTLALTLAAGATLPALAADAPPTQHVRGTIAAVAGSKLTITTAHGPVVVMLGAKTGFAGVVPATMADVTPGTFVGIANVDGSGPSRALEVAVFPKSMNGTGEGNYGWDLPAGGAKSSAMTNGTVAGGSMMKSSTMTNATVSKMSGKTITMTYKGGTKRIAIPDGVPIVKFVPATKSVLEAGAPVFAIATKSATPSAAFVVVGENGTKPPM